MPLRELRSFVDRRTGQRRELRAAGRAAERTATTRALARRSSGRRVPRRRTARVHPRTSSRSNRMAQRRPGMTPAKYVFNPDNSHDPRSLFSLPDGENGRRCGGRCRFRRHSRRIEGGASLRGVFFPARALAVGVELVLLAEVPLSVPRPSPLCGESRGRARAGAGVLPGEPRGRAREGRGAAGEGSAVGAALVLGVWRAARGASACCVFVALSGGALSAVAPEGVCGA